MGIFQAFIDYLKEGGEYNKQYQRDHTMRESDYTDGPDCKLKAEIMKRSEWMKDECTLEQRMHYDQVQMEKLKTFDYCTYKHEDY